MKRKTSRKERTSRRNKGPKQQSEVREDAARSIGFGGTTLALLAVTAAHPKQPFSIGLSSGVFGVVKNKKDLNITNW